MSKKQIKFLIPLGALLLTLVMLAGCRPSEALTRLMNAINALNPATEEMKTEEEQEENEPDDNMDPIDEERDDAKLQETEELIGQMLDNMDEETADQAMDAIYSAVATSSDWGVQQYNPDRITDAEDEDSALARYVRGSLSRAGSGTVGTAAGSGGTTTIKREGLTSSNGRQSETVPVTQNTESEEPTDQTGGGQGNSSSYGYGDGSTGGNIPEGEGGSSEPETSEPETSEPETSEPETSEPETSEPETSEPDTSGDHGTFYGHTIAATGDVAVLVCMLGGADRLVATNADFYNDPLVKAAWGDQLVNCVVLWDGDGKTALDSDKFRYLMEDIQPDLCTQIAGYNTFSSDPSNNQVDAIQWTYKLGYYAVSPMTSWKGIRDAMLGLDNAMYYDEDSDDGMQVYLDYIEWCNKYMGAIQERSDGSKMEVVYIEGWDGNVEIYHENNNGKTLVSNDGMAYIRPGTEFRPLSTFLGYANVTDYASAPMRNYMCTTTNAYKPRRTWESYGTTGGAWSCDGDTCYVTPLCDETGNIWQQLNEGGVGTLSIDNLSPGITELTGYNANYTFGSMVDLGESGSTNFRTIITKDQATADAIRSSWQWHWDSKNYQNVGNTYNTDGHNGYLDVLTTPIGNFKVASNVLGDYDIIVQPAGGIGSWVEGSPESILEAAWAACKLQGCYGNTESENQNILENIIDEFYRTFYGFSPYQLGLLDEILKTN